MVFGTGIGGDGQPLSFQIRLGIDGIQLLFNLRHHGQESLYHLGALRFVFPVFAKPYIQFRMEVGHNPRKSGGAMLQRVQQRSGIGIKQTQVCPLNALQTSADQRCVAAGIFEKMEPSRLGRIRNLVVGNQSFVGIGTFIKAQRNLLRKGLEQIIQISFPNIRFAALLRQTIGDQNYGVYTGIRHPLELLRLIVDVIGGMAGGNHRNLGSFLDETRQLHPLFEAEKEHFAGLTDGKQSVHAPRFIPADQRFQRGIIHLTGIGEGGEHDWPYAIFCFGCHEKSLIPV